MRLDNAEAIKAMVKARMGISLAPWWAVTAEIKQRGLTLVRLKEPPLLGHLVLVARKPGHPAHSVKAFIEVAQKWQWKNARWSNPARLPR